MNKDAATIRKEFRRSEEARYIHRLHGVLLVLRGLSTVAAGKLLGDPQRTIAHWVNQFKEHGLSGLRDAEKSGRPSILSANQQKALFAALKGFPIDVGLEGDTWTGALVSTFLRKHHHVKLTMRHCRRLLRAFEEST